MRSHSSRFVPSLAAFLGGLVSAGILAVIRTIYPAAALLVANERAAGALFLVSLVVVLSILRGLVSGLTAQNVRLALYERVGRAVAVFPALSPADAPSIEQIEAQVARGIPWVEARYAHTWPGLIGNAMALPVIAYLTITQIGLRVSLLAGGVLLVAAAVSTATARIAARAADVAWSHYQDITSLVEHGLRGRIELRVHGLAEAHRRKLEARVQGWSVLDRRMRVLGAMTGISVPLSALALGLSLAALMGFNLVPWLLDVLAPSSARGLGAGLCLVATLPLLFSLSRQLAELAYQQPYVHSLEYLLQLQDCDVPGPGFDKRSPIGDVVFEQVQFAYPNTEPLRRRIISADFVWRERESIALVGPNGCGKTTVALGLLGALKPQRGSIVVRDEAGTCSLSLPPVSCISYLSQDPYMDEAESIRQSIHFVAPGVGDPEMRNLLERLGFDGDVNLERRVAALSTGQRRLVALARVLLRDAELLILDEPEANLGTRARERAIELLREMKPRRRMLILTHHEGFAAVADRVLTFDERSVRDPEPPCLVSSRRTGSK